MGFHFCLVGRDGVSSRARRVWMRPAWVHSVPILSAPLRIRAAVSLASAALRRGPCEAPSAKTKEAPRRRDGADAKVESEVWVLRASQGGEGPCQATPTVSTGRTPSPAATPPATPPTCCPNVPKSVKFWVGRAQIRHTWAPLSGKIGSPPLAQLGSISAKFGRRWAKLGRISAKAGRGLHKLHPIRLECGRGRPRFAEFGQSRPHVCRG